MKRFMLSIIVVLLCILFCVYASAEERQYVTENESLCLENEFTDVDSLSFSLRYTNIDSVYAYLSISGDTAYCSGNIQTSNSGATTSVSVRLQRSANGSSWSTVKTWSGNGTNSTDVSGQYTVSSGFRYRVSVYGRVLDQNGGLLESTTKYSAVKTH